MRLRSLLVILTEVGDPGHISPEARTVRQLASLIQKTGTPSATVASSSAVVSIREQGTRLPIFLISGLGGEVIAFDTLARHLGHDQPVFALLPQGLDGRSPYLTRVEDMAEYYLREIRTRRPRGPYCLAGYSFGGYVIFEMAQQLLAAGESVALLGFLDTIECQYFEGVTHPKGLRQRWALRLNRIRYRRWDYVKERVSHTTARIVDGLFQRLGRLRPQSASTLEKINLLAMAQYKPSVYPGKLTIFRSVTRDEAFGDDELLGWGGLVSGGIEVQDVTGRHLDRLIEPNVRVLAEKLRMCLDQVQIASHEAHSHESADIETHPAPVIG
jgi:thioesterase domain-containing protein